MATSAPGFTLAPEIFSTALNDTFDAIVITTADLELPGPTIVYVNRAFEQMTGYSAQETLGKTPRMLQGPETDRRILDELRRSLQAGRRFSGVVINYRKDGTKFWLEWRISPVRDAAGRITHWLSFQRDITAHRRAVREGGY